MSCMFPALPNIDWKRRQSFRKQKTAKRTISEDSSVFGSSSVFPIEPANGLIANGYFRISSQWMPKPVAMQNLKRTILFLP